MKFFVLVIVAATLVGVNSLTFSNPKERFPAYKEACVEETGVDAEKISHLRYGDFSDVDDELNNFVFCFFKMYRVVTDEGILKKDYIISIIPAYLDREKCSEVIDACMREMGANPQETAFFQAKCIDENYKDLSMFKHM